MACDISTTANTLFTSLTGDLTNPPTIDLTDPSFDFTPSNTDDITVDELTTITLDGDGIFDKLMRTVDLHIHKEFKEQRITGSEYALVYTKMMTAVLSQSSQILLTKNQARWQARMAEIQSITSMVELETSKVSAHKAVYDMKTSAASYGLAKSNIILTQAQHCQTEAETASIEYKTTNILPVEKIGVDKGNLLLEGQLSQLTTQTSKIAYELSDLMPIEKSGLTKDNLVKDQQVSQLVAQTSKIVYEVANIMPLEKTGLSKDHLIKDEQKTQLVAQTSKTVYEVSDLLPAQKSLISEKFETERAQTLDLRSDGITTIVGSVGKQKDLYSQQITSYKRDSEFKAAKMYLDSWITQKTIDEGLTAPTEFTNATIDSVMATYRANNSL